MTGGLDVTRSYALRTADGGALVLYAMYLNTIQTAHRSASVAAGPPIPVPANFVPLLTTGPRPAPTG